ncbi:hypothetical protein C0Q70_05915 [Pomacea canaliculata]|uniref:Uncharacterized protein n=1 Tax=Pomacea canaliculata TaxID=400727 RepID=A0A2T7PMH5_POMCA|nr:hypothetical protein C0Q70_05915 [Pomacea canaliculata]
MRPKPWSSLHIYAMGRGEARSVAVVLVVVWFSSLPSANAAICDSNYGPSGSLDCFLGVPYYDGYQWGTCLSNQYIRTKSKAPPVLTVTGSKIAWRRSTSALEYETRMPSLLRELLAQSICSQAPMDFWYMFWIIRSSFITSYSESLVGLLKISKTCVPRANQMQSGMRKVAIKIRVKSKSLRQRRAADPDLLNAIQAFVFLADKQGYGISDPVSYNLSEVVQRAAQAFQNGDIVVTSLGGESVELQTMSGCSDIDCESVYLETTAPSSAPPQSTIAGVTGLVLAALVRLLK